MHKVRVFVDGSMPRSVGGGWCAASERSWTQVWVHATVSWMTSYSKLRAHSVWTSRCRWLSNGWKGHWRTSSSGRLFDGRCSRCWWHPDALFACSPGTSTSWVFRSPPSHPRQCARMHNMFEEVSWYADAWHGVRKVSQWGLYLVGSVPILLVWLTTWHRSKGYIVMTVQTMLIQATFLILWQRCYKGSCKWKRCCALSHHLVSSCGSARVANTRPMEMWSHFLKIWTIFACCFHICLKSLMC